jgi:iron complex outermembrane recepter protein
MNIKTLLATACACAWVLAAPGYAIAQDAENETVDDQEIVVTANKRTESIQDVAISISAIKPEALQVKGASDYRDYLTGIAGVSLVDFGTGSSNVIFRGLATAPDGDGSGGTTVTYFDEIPLGGGLAAVELQPIDIARVEVLRGPQGTLYGAGALSGILRFVPNKTKLGEFSGNALATVADLKGGSGLDYQGETTVNVPLGSSIAFRATGYYERNAGFVSNLRDDTIVGGSKRYGAQASAFVELGSNTDFLIRYVYNKTKNNGQALSSFGLPPFSVDRLPQPERSDLHLVSGTFNHDFGFATLTSVTGYRRSTSQAFRDVTQYYTDDDNNPDTIPPVYALSIRNDRDSVFSQEIRLQSPDNSRFEWIIGAFYTRTRGVSDGALFDPTLLGQPTALLLPLLDNKDRDTQKAVFADIGWNISDQIRLGVGGRYAKYRVRSTDLLNPGTPDRTASDSAFTPKFSVEFRPDENKMFYAQAAKGFRNGGFNGTPKPGDCPGTYPAQFKPDSIWSYELGSKITLPNRRGTINGAVFYSDWTGIPIFQNLLGAACNPVSFFDNLGKATSKGFELEANLRPSERLTVALTASYAKTTLTDSNGRFVRQPLPSSPEWNLGADVDYKFPLSGSTNASLGAAVRTVSRYAFYLEEDYQDARGFLNLPFDTSPRGGGYVTADLRAGLELGAFDVSLFVNNVFDSQGVTTFQVFSGDGRVATAFQRARTIGVTVRAGF